MMVAVRGARARTCRELDPPRARRPQPLFRMETPGPSSAPLISDDPSQRYQHGLNTLKDTQRMVR